MVIATTEEVLLSDPLAASDMTKAASGGIKSFIICKDEADEVKKNRLLIAIGYDGDPEMVELICGGGGSSAAVIGAISERSGARAEKIGLRAAQGEFKDMDSSGAKVLEIQYVKMNCMQTLAAINSYQVLLSLVLGIQLPSGLVSEDAVIKGLFRYMPRLLPLHYAEEIETYRNVVKVIKSAA